MYVQHSELKIVCPSSHSLAVQTAFFLLYWGGKKGLITNPYCSLDQTFFPPQIQKKKAVWAARLLFTCMSHKETNAEFAYDHTESNNSPLFNGNTPGIQN